MHVASELFRLQLVYMCEQDKANHRQSDLFRRCCAHPDFNVNKMISLSPTSFKATLKSLHGKGKDEKQHDDTEKGKEPLMLVPLLFAAAGEDKQIINPRGLSRLLREMKADLDLPCWTGASYRHLRVRRLLSACVCDFRG